MSEARDASLVDPVERRRRRIALGALGVMMLVFIVLSAFSFVGSRGQVVPEAISYAAAFEAVDGKRVFQAYNCMGCHTVVGNGAYFAPDLTDVYERAGPAWLAAYLPSAGSWPTEAALRTQLQGQHQLAETGIDELEEYYRAFPGARERVERRGGSSAYMPNLTLTGQQVNELIAFLKYTSALDTEGWPPTPKVDGLQHPLAVGLLTYAGGAPSGAPRSAPGFVLTSAPAPAATAAAPAGASSGAPPGGDLADGGPAALAPPVDAAARGAEIAQQYGCLACHAVDDTTVVGPGWGGLFGSHETLVDGASVLVDEAYLAESIRLPDARLVAGFQPGTMPAYANVLSEDEIAAIVAYIVSLETP